MNCPAPIREGCTRFADDFGIVGNARFQRVYPLGSKT